MTVVVGFIPTPEGRAALAQARTEAQRRGSRLTVVATIDPVQSKDQRDRERILAELDQVATELRGEGVEHEVRAMDRGRLPSEDILEVAEELRAWLIVIGLRRRTAVGKFLMGSHAQQIILDAPCPVLSVKASG